VTYKPSLLKLLQIIENMLLAPAINTPYLRRIVTNLNPLKNRNNTGPNSTEVKFDF
jgi:hypothetical protein